jgi:hypothetical protein
MKRCMQCKQEKPLDQFFKAKNGAKEVRSDCKECKQLKTQKWREENKKRYNTVMRAANKRHALRNRLRRYRLTIEQYQTLKEIQNNLCAVCGKAPAINKPLVVDHEHGSKKVRGLLCYKCNRDMAVVDNTEHLNALLTYRNKHS